MSDWNQEEPGREEPAGGPAPGAAPPAEWTPWSEPGPPSPDVTTPPEPVPDRYGPFPPPGMLAWALALAVLGLGALALRQIEAAFLVGVAGLFVVAQGADTRPQWRFLQDAVGWVPPLAGAMFLGALAWLVGHEGPPSPFRYAAAGFSALGALVSLVLFSGRAADAVARVLLRGSPPGHTARLAARVVLLTLWLALPAWFVFKDSGDELMANPSRLVSRTGLSVGLVGYVVLALAGVGLLVRRGWKESFARLGIAVPGTAATAVVPLGVVALWLFNVGSESLQRQAFPALWASDQRFAEVLARGMGPGTIVLLGLSAGIGEEITLRGALQPRLGIVLTSLLFAVLHVQYSWYGMLSIFGFGLILGLIRRHGSTTSAMAVHALYNMLALAASKP